MDFLHREIGPSKFQVCWHRVATITLLMVIGYNIFRIMPLVLFFLCRLYNSLAHLLAYLVTIFACLLRSRCCVGALGTRGNSSKSPWLVDLTLDCGDHQSHVWVRAGGLGGILEIPWAKANLGEPFPSLVWDLNNQWERETRDGWRGRLAMTTVTSRQWRNGGFIWTYAGILWFNCLGELI